MKSIITRNSLGRMRTKDVAYPFVMPAGFAGDVNRGHPASILPAQLDPNNPLTAFGQAAMASTAVPNTVRLVAIGDAAATAIWGVSVRPYPFQAQTATNYGAVGAGGAPALVQPIDILTAGYILVPVVGAVIKGGSVWVWVGATGGGHTLGGFEGAGGGGNTMALAGNYLWNSPADATGLAELKITL